MVNGMWGYEGRQVVVTGAASGMGLACTEILHGLGAEVVALDLVKPDAPVARFIATDMRDPRTIDAAVAAIDGPVHALFNVVGIPPIRSGTEVMTINFLGPRHLTEGIIPKMTDGGAIACVATILVGLDQGMPRVRELLAIDDFDAAVAWCDAHPEVVVEGYMFSKHCISGYTLVRSTDLVHQGIRINCIGPTTTDTPFLRGLAEVMPVEAADQFVTIMGRRSLAEEQAYPLVFLNSAMASYVNGAVIPTDGGFTAALTTGRLAMPG
jgi:NAD(P)-dependent dehydrogenase (short-subunit alcohol dehydrogenase family)